MIARTVPVIRELLDNCSRKWVTIGKVSGRKFTSKNNGNAIFFPAAGCRYGDDLYGVGLGGYYWSASLSVGNSCDACDLYFNSDDVGTDHGVRYDGLPVRAVLRY